MANPDDILSNDLNLIGANPVRATVPVRRLLSKDLAFPSSCIAALLLIAGDKRDTCLPVVSETDLPDVARQIHDRGIKGVKLFVDSYAPSSDASEVGNTDSLYIRALRILKNEVPELCVITDTCLCSYTSDGACAITNKDGSVDHDTTFSRLEALAENQVRAGADIIGPAPMMDGAVGTLRRHLDSIGFQHIPLMPHLSWRSSLYRVYRNTMQTGDGLQRQAFQIDPSRTEYFFEMGMQMKREGAAIIQLQPGLLSIDVVGALKKRANVPLALYSVSGEYAMMRMSAAGESEFQALLHEHATVCLRSGADYLITYAWRELT